MSLSPRPSCPQVTFDTCGFADTKSRNGVPTLIKITGGRVDCEINEDTECCRVMTDDEFAVVGGHHNPNEMNPEDLADVCYDCSGCASNGAFPLARPVPGPAPAKAQKKSSDDDDEDDGTLLIVIVVAVAAVAVVAVGVAAVVFAQGRGTVTQIQLLDATELVPAVPSTLAPGARVDVLKV